MYDFDEIKADQKFMNELIKQEQEELYIQPSPGIHYGYMWFSTCDVHGIYVTDSKVLKTDDDITIITDYIHDSILSKLEKNIIGTYLFYQVEDINPNIVSYQLITRSNYPCVTVYIRDSKHKKFCYIKGNGRLYDALYNNLPYLKRYDDTSTRLHTMNKDALKKEHFIIYTQMNVHLSKKMIIKDLLQNKKREFIKN